MSEKQDRQGVRTASQLEQKYQFGQRFAEIMGIATDARDKVDSVESELRSEIAEQYTKISRDTEKIIMEALTEYVNTSDYEKFQQTVSAQFKIMSDEISANLKSTTDLITSVSDELALVDGALQETKESLDSYTVATDAFKETVTNELSNVNEDLQSVKDDLVLHYEANSKFQEECESEFSATAKQIALNMTSTTESFTEVNAKIESTQGDIEEEHRFTEELREYCESEFAASAESLDLKFQSTTEQITNVNGDVQSMREDLQKHFEFSENGLTIKAGENEMKLVIDNDLISFYKGEIKDENRFGWWDGVNFHTGNIFVEVRYRAQFGDFAFVPRSNGSLDFLKVGG